MPPTLQQAMDHHRTGRLAEAEQIYAAIAAAEPANVAAQQMLGTLKLQQGRMAEAVRCFDRAIAAKPDLIEAHNNRGIALCSLQRYADAVGSFDRVLALKPKTVDTLVNRAVALHALKRVDAALADLQAALALQPRYLQALVAGANLLTETEDFEKALDLFNRAIALQPQDAELRWRRGRVLVALSRPAEALADLDRAVQRAPGAGEAWNYRGGALRDLGRAQEAAESFHRAVTLRPNHASAHYNLGLVLFGLRRLEDAVASFDRALALNPDNADAWNDRSLALKDLRRDDEALASAERALALAPDDPRAFNNKGAVLWEMGRIDEAQACLDRALALDPALALAWRNRGSMLWAKKKLLGPALADLERAVALEPDTAFSRGELLHLRTFAGDWGNFDGEKAALDAGVRAGKAVVQPFVYQAISESPAALLACAKIYADAMHPARPPLVTARARSNRKIRIGYVCGEFRDHATSYLTVGLYECHDRAKFEVVAFDNGAGDGSAVRGRLEAAFDKLIPIAALDSDSAAARVAAEAIDILVNLNGYYGNARMDLFARKPAPIQVNYLGFPGTLGASFMDYIVADEVVIPAGEERFYTEQVVRLPGCYQANDSKRGAPDLSTTRAEHGVPEEAFVFCHFNHTYKLTPAMFRRWTEILKRVPGSVLWLLESDPLFAPNIRREAEAAGIDPARLVFAPVIPHEKHLARLALGDLFLDSLPYTAHTTGSDALWMGMPLLTCLGTTFPGRVAASLLHAVGLPELIAKTWDDYTALAVALAADRGRLAALRRKLIAARTRAPLFDTVRYTRALEAAYERMIAICEKGEGTMGFIVNEAPT